MSATAAGRTPAIATVPTAAEGGSRERALVDLIEALQAESHEYANKIHTIAGLLSLDMADAAEGLLSDLAAEHVAGGASLLERIDSPALVGLLVSKRAAGRARGVSVRIDEASSLEELPAGLSEVDAISLVGNFIDNAFDAVDPLPPERRLVVVGIYQQELQTRFRVADHGAGLDPLLGDRFCEAGHTSKPGHPGLGLAIVEAVLERSAGDLEVRCGPAGAIFEASFRTT